VYILFQLCAYHTVYTIMCVIACLLTLVVYLDGCDFAAVITLVVHVIAAGTLWDDRARVPDPLSCHYSGCWSASLFLYRAGTFVVTVPVT